MSVNLSFTINATNAHELRRAIQELAAVIEASAKEAQGVDSVAVTTKEPVREVDNKPSATPTEEPSVSMEDVRAKLATLVKDGKQAAVKELLASFGASKLSDVPAERYGELMQKASEIA